MALLPIAIKAIHPLKDNILVTDLIFDERVSAGGIVLLNDDMKSTGIRPRWAKVYAIGPEQKDITIGQWICIEHGRWTRGIKVEVPILGNITLHKVDNNAIMLVSDEPVNDYTMSDKATG
jgi:co-chaperonin GroES (HSP10)